MAVAGISGLFSLAGTAVSMFGAHKQYKAQKEAEKARRQQMALEAARARREQIRKSQVSRAQATAAAVNQGAGDSSALEGGRAQTMNEAGRNISAINQDENLGNSIFKANAKAAKGQFYQSLGGGISSLGGAFSSSAGTITRLGAGSTASAPTASNSPFFKKDESAKGWSLFG